MHYSITGLNELAIYKILVDMLNELVAKDLISSLSEPLPGYQISKFESENTGLYIGSTILKIATTLKDSKVNGRDLRRLPFKVFSSLAMKGSAHSKIPIDIFLEETVKLLSKTNNKVAVIF
jgi:hypothetical protein